MSSIEKDLTRRRPFIANAPTAPTRPYPRQLDFAFANSVQNPEQQLDQHVIDYDKYSDVSADNQYNTDDYPEEDEDGDRSWSVDCEKLLLSKEQEKIQKLNALYDWVQKDQKIGETSVFRCVTVDRKKLTTSMPVPEFKNAVGEAVICISPTAFDFVDPLETEGCYPQNVLLLLFQKGNSWNTAPKKWKITSTGGGLQL